MNKPKMRMMAPAIKPVGREEATPRYGNGMVNTYIDIGTATKPHCINWVFII